jgi:hypothetical protein
MIEEFGQHLSAQLAGIRSAGTYKRARVIITPQGVPLCRAHAPGSPADGLEVNFKGGQVGAEDYFGAVARGEF